MLGISQVDNASQMKAEQDSLERKLWEERQDIVKKHEEKVKAARAKYVMNIRPV